MLTRRAALQGGTAVAVSAAVGTAASAVAIPVSANPDANLEALHAEWQAAERACSAAADRADAAGVALHAAEPSVEVPMPDGSSRTCRNEAHIEDAINVWWREHPEMKKWEREPLPKAEAEAFAHIMSASNPEEKREAGLEYRRLNDARTAPVTREIEGRKQAALQDLACAQGEYRGEHLEREYQALHQEQKRRNERSMALGEQLWTTPAHTPRGLLLKLDTWVGIKTEVIHEILAGERPVNDLCREEGPIVAVMLDLKRMDAAAFEGATVAQAAPIPIASTIEEPLLEMESEWIARRDHYRTYPDESDEARDPLLDRLIETEVHMHRTPATTPAGIAVKLRMWARHHGSGFSGDWWTGSVEEFGHNLDVVPIIGALRDAERLAGRAQS